MNACILPIHLHAYINYKSPIRSSTNFYLHLHLSPTCIHPPMPACLPATLTFHFLSPRVVRHQRVESEATYKLLPSVLSIGRRVTLLSKVVFHTTVMFFSGISTSTYIYMQDWTMGLGREKKFDLCMCTEQVTHRCPWCPGLSSAVAPSRGLAWGSGKRIAKSSYHHYYTQSYLDSPLGKERI